METASVRSHLNVVLQADFRLDQVSDQQLRETQAAIGEYLAGVMAWSVPATDAEIYGMLADFSDMLQVPAPKQGGLDLYCAALCDMPSGLLKRAVVHVARTHRYARLPLPADFEKAIAGELAWLEMKHQNTSATMNRIERALGEREARNRRHPT